MKKKKSTIVIEVLKDLPGYPAGKEVPVDVDDRGIPMSRYWRARLKDAELDDCCKIQKKRTKKASKGTKT